jgi:SAM-dependent methyltransferase
MILQTASGMAILKAAVKYRDHNHDPEAESILGWDDAFVTSLKSRLLALHSKTDLAADDLKELRSHGLLEDVTGEPSPLGRRLIDLVVREEWQDHDEFETIVRDVLPENPASVLEVGCSSGRKLRTWWGDRLSRRVGVDVDSKALALGCVFARQENQPVDFYCCSGHSLPFPAASFDFVICRNALTYMHHRTALREMSRVLKPNGLLFIRFENIWFDFAVLSHPRGPKAFFFVGRNFVFGVLLALFGRQPTPGGRLWGWRAFATRGQLRRVLRSENCEIIRLADSQNCPRFLGFSTQTSLLAKKVK